MATLTRTRAKHHFMVDGYDVTKHVAINTLAIQERLGSVASCQFQLKLSEDDGLGDGAIIELVTEDSMELATEDGDLIILDNQVREPSTLAPVTISYPRTTYRDAALVLTPWAHYPLDEAHTGTVHDLAQKNIGAFGAASSTLNFRQSAPVPYGGAAGCDEDYTGVFVTAPTLGTSTAAWSVAFWLKLDASNAQAGRILYAGTNKLLVDRTSGNAVSVKWGATTLYTTTGDFSETAWKHIAITGNATTIVIYVDGSQVDSNTGTYAALAATDRFRFGAYESTSNRNLGGLFDEISIWRSVITAASIADMVAGRNAKRRFDGFLQRKERHGYPGRGFAITDCDCVSRAVFFKRNRTSALLSSTGSDSVTTVIEQLIETELPNLGISTGGVNIADTVPMRQTNLETISSLLDQFQTEFDAPWRLDPMNELHQVKRSNAPTASLVLTDSLADEAGWRRVTDSRLFRNVETVVHAGGNLHAETFTGDGSTRVWELSYPFDRVLAVQLGGTAEDVDTLDGDTTWTVTNKTLAISPAQDAPASGTDIVVTYTDTDGTSRSQTFTGDGSARSWTLTYTPRTPISQNVTVVAGGVTEEVDRLAGQWATDRDQNSLIRPLTETAPASGQQIVVSYYSAASSSVTQRSADSVNQYGPWGSLQVANSVRGYRAKQALARGLLDRYDSPIEGITGSVRRGFVSELEVGAKYKVQAPNSAGVNEEVANWILEAATMREEEGNRLVWSLRLLRGAYAPRFEDFYERAMEPNVPPAADTETATSGAVAEIVSGETLNRVGSRLPAFFGGSESSNNESGNWVRCRDTAILTFVGIFLPAKSARLSFCYRIRKGSGSGTWTARVRLRDLTAPQTVSGSEITLSVNDSQAGTVRTAETPALTIPPGTRNYAVEVQCQTAAYIAVWGAQLAV